MTAVVPWLGLGCVSAVTMHSCTVVIGINVEIKPYATAPVGFCHSSPNFTLFTRYHITSLPVFEQLGQTLNTVTNVHFVFSITEEQTVVTHNLQHMRLVSVAISKLYKTFRMRCFIKCGLKQAWG